MGETERHHPFLDTFLTPANLPSVKVRLRRLNDASCSSPVNLPQITESIDIAEKLMLVLQDNASDSDSAPQSASELGYAHMYQFVLDYRGLAATNSTPKVPVGFPMKPDGRSYYTDKLRSQEDIQTTLKSDYWVNHPLRKIDWTCRPEKAEKNWKKASDALKKVLFTDRERQFLAEVASEFQTTLGPFIRGDFDKLVKDLLVEQRQGLFKQMTAQLKSQ